MGRGVSGDHTDVNTAGGETGDVRLCNDGYDCDKCGLVRYCTNKHKYEVGGSHVDLIRQLTHKLLTF